MRRKSVRKEPATDRDKLIFIVERRFSNADQWLEELARWPDADLDVCLKRIEAEKSECLSIGDLDGAQGCDGDIISAKQAAAYTFDVHARGSIEEEYKIERETMLEYRSTEAEQRRFFHQPDCNADFEDFFATDFLTIEESAAYCLGKNPSKVSKLSLMNVSPESAFKKDFEALVDRISRFQKAGGLGKNELITPKQLTAWVRKHNIPVTASFNEACARKGAGGRNSDDVREIHTLYKMLLCLVWCDHGYQPWNGSTVSIQDIYRKLDKVGKLEVVSKTWTRHLGLAVTYAIEQGMIKEKV